MAATWPTVARAAERAIRSAIVGVFGAGVRRRDPGAVANAALALAITYVPDLAERRYGVEFRPWQRLYAGIAVLAHAVGMLGPYDRQGWWDHVTHTLSATLLGGAAHVVARRRGRDPASYVLATVGGGGLLWELGEYLVHAVCERLGIEPLLIPYSARDTALDLCFNTLGALVVLAFGDRLFGNFVSGDSD